MTARGALLRLQAESTRRAEAGLLVMTVVWAVNFSAIKVGLQSFAPFAFNALRFPLAAGLLTAGVVAAGRLGLPERRDRLRVIGLGIVGHVAYQVLFIHGMARTRAGNASLLLTGAAVYTAFLSGVLGHERVGPRAWLGVGATVGGIALVVGSGPAGFSFGSETVIGDLLIMAAAFFWSVYTVGARSMVRKYGSLRVTAWVLSIGAACLLLLGLPDLLRLEPAPPVAWAAVVYAGLLGIGLANLLWYRGVRAIGNTRTSVFQNLVPILAILVAWAWLGEVPTVGQVVGAVIIIGGVTVVRRAVEPAR
ncbi:MAG: DMT family transporter [Gemmatimonadota bacterium]